MSIMTCSLACREMDKIPSTLTKVCLNSWIFSLAKTASHTAWSVANESTTPYKKCFQSMQKYHHNQQQFHFSSPAIEKMTAIMIHRPHCHFHLQTSSILTRNCLNTKHAILLPQSESAWWFQTWTWGLCWNWWKASNIALLGAAPSCATTSVAASSGCIKSGCKDGTKAEEEELLSLSSSPTIPVVPDDSSSNSTTGDRGDRGLWSFGVGLLTTPLPYTFQETMSMARTKQRFKHCETSAIAGQRKMREKKLTNEERSADPQ